MIGAVGIQLTLDQTARVARLLPFWGPRQLLEGSLGTPISTPHAVEIGLAYTLVLLVVTFTLAFRRLRVAPHARAGPTPDPAG
jgi:hypothetical protein